MDILTSSELSILENKYFASGLDITSINLSNSLWYSVDCPHSSIINSRGTGIKWTNVNLGYSDITNLELRLSELNQVTFDQANLYKCEYRDLILINCSFNKTRLIGTLFYGCTFNDCDFTDVGIVGSFQNCKFDDCTFNHDKVYSNHNYHNCQFKGSIPTTKESFKHPDNDDELAENCIMAIMSSALGFILLLLFL